MRIHTFRFLPRLAAGLIAAASGLFTLSGVHADTGTTMAAPAESVVEVKFREFFRMPIGPRGLEITEKAAALNGKRVSIVGFLAQPSDGHAHDAGAHGHDHGHAHGTAKRPTLPYAILAPLPITLGDEDEHLVDDLPPTAVFVHAPTELRALLTWRPGPVRVTGTLDIGNREEAGDRVSGLRVNIDSPAGLESVMPRQAAR